MEHILSILYAFWPGLEPPSEGEAAQLFAAPKARPTDPFPAPNRLWGRGWELEGRRYFSAWAGYVEDLPSGIGLTVLAHPPALKRQLRKARFYVGFLTWLDRDDPFRSYQELHRICLRLCPDAPAVFDASSVVLRDAEQVRALVESPEPPTIHGLYRTEAITPRRDGEGFWVHTHGLERAGFPDVEILDVPPEHVEGGVRLIHRFVDRHFGRELPEQGEEMVLVPDCPVAWLSLETVLRDRRADATGGANDRRHGSHDGWRAFLAQREAPGSDEWAQPLDAMAALVRACPACEATGGRTEADAKQARATWTRFARNFVDHGRSTAWQFLARTEAGNGSDEENAAESWIAVDAVRKTRFCGRPVEQLGDESAPRRWHHVDHLLDWQIVGPWGTIEPHSPEGGGS